MATIAVLLGSITGLLAALIGWLFGASGAMIALSWAGGCLAGSGGLIVLGLLRRSGRDCVGEVIAADLRALGPS